MDDVVAQLLTDPVPLAEVNSGVPAERGLYAWWAAPGALPGIEGPRHGEYELLYVGIAPNRPSSHATLRSRLVRDHIRGGTGNSTLRRALAALLSEQEGWRNRWTTRAVLVEEDEARLSAWMEQRLRVTWARHDEPWTVERAVIERMTPPLNQADNQGHPLYEHVRAARARWRASAESQR
jgi:hypothetical protein